MGRVLLLVLSAGVIISSAKAQSCSVTSTADTTASGTLRSCVTSGATTINMGSLPPLSLIILKSPITTSSAGTITFQGRTDGSVTITGGPGVQGLFIATAATVTVGNLLLSNTTGTIVSSSYGVTLSNSTLNCSSTSGTGVNAAGPISLTNTTITGCGTGIIENSTLNMSQSTVYGNSVDVAGQGSSVSMTRSVVGSINLGTGPYSAPAGNYVGTGAMLGPLQLNGGFLPTMLPSPGSPLIGIAGAGASTTDERGFGGKNPGDAGAVQTHYALVTSLADSGAGTLRTVLESAGNSGVDITFGSLVSASSPGTITVGSSLFTNGRVNLAGPGANALSISGGGSVQVIVNAGSLALNGVTITDGYSEQAAGAIDNGSNLTITNSAITNSVAQNGGGIFDIGLMVMQGSTLSGNTGTLFGGGLADGGTGLQILNSTIGNNKAPGSAGAEIDTEGNVTLIGATISKNTATGNGLTGGIEFDSASAYLANDLIEGNVAGEMPDLREQTTYTDGGGNLVNTTNNETTPKLAPLAYNGGTTQTMLPLPGSPAICAGTLANALVTSTADQRGFPRTNTTYAGYSSASPCVDAGAAQTHYTSVVFAEQPTNSAVSPADVTPAPYVEVLETNSNLSSPNTNSVAGVAVSMTLTGTGTLGGTTSVTTAGGTLQSNGSLLTGAGATFSALTVSQQGTGDTLTADLSFTAAGSSSVTSLKGTSSAFNVTAPVTATVTTSPAGLAFAVDGTPFLASHQVAWGVGGVHTLTTMTPQTLSGVPYDFAHWTDGTSTTASTTDTVTVPNAASVTYTGVFAPRYLLTFSASNAAYGSVTATVNGTAVTSGSYFLPGTVVTLTAAQSTGYYFAGWMGSSDFQSTTTATTTLTMNANETVTASFVANPVFTVTSTADTNDGSCTANLCTLRDAVTAANALGVYPIPAISFSASIVSSATASAPATITLGSTLSLTHAMSIDGLQDSNGKNLIRINGNGTQVMSVPSAAGSNAIRVGELTLTDGSAPNYGGGLNVSGGQVTLAGVTVSGNSAQGGGGIAVTGGSLTVESSTILANTATYYGGDDIYISGGSLSIIDTSIQGLKSNYYVVNGGGLYVAGGTVSLTRTSVTGASIAGYGGGIFVAGGTLLLTDSTVSGNVVGWYPVGLGGGMYLKGGTTTLNNSTVSGNEGGQDTSGIHLAGGSLVMNNSTVTGSTTIDPPQGTPGAGVYNTGSGTVTMYNSIVSGNQGDPASMTIDSNGNVLGGSADLAPLGNYGGTTQTNIPLPGSPAICAGLNSFAALGGTTDQRGDARTNASYAGYTGNTPCVDAGAVQTAYGLGFTAEPPSNVLVDMNFSAATELTESGAAFAPAVTIPLTLNGSGVLTNGSATTSSGTATYASLAVNMAGSDTLKASLTLNGALAVSATSSTFVVEDNTATLSVQPATALAGSSVQVSATLSYASVQPTGAVTFQVDAGASLAATCTGSASPLTCTATYPTTGLAVGSHALTASLAGDSVYNAATSSAATLTITPPRDYTAATTSVSATSATQTASVLIATGGTLGSINVVTQGAANLDFALVTGGTCTVGTAYTAGQGCTVEYTFQPRAPGERLGGVVLESNAATPVVMGTELLQGMGQGAQALWQTGVSSATLANNDGLVSARSLAVDAFGDVYVANSGADAVLKFIPGNPTRARVATDSGYSVTSVAVDGAGDVFYGAANGIFEVPVGSTTPVSVNSTLLTSDDNLSVDAAGNLYTSDVNTGAIYELVAPNYGTTTTLIAGSSPSVHRFIGMAVDASGNVFAADFKTSTLYEVKVGTGALTQLYAGSPLNQPHTVALDPAGDVYVANYQGTYAMRFSAGNYAAAPATLGVLAQESLAVGSDGSIYSVYSNDVLYQYTRATNPALSFTSAVGVTTGAQTATLENDGNIPLTVASVSTGSVNFAASAGSLASPFAAGSAIPIAVTFTPQTDASSTATLTVTDNSLNASAATQTVALAGAATAGTPVVTVLSPAAYAGTPVVLTATVSYGGVAPTGAVTFSIDGGAATAAATCTTAGSPESCTLSYGTRTLATGTHTLSATIASDANYNGATSGSATLTIVAPNYMAPSTGVGSTSATQTATVIVSTAGTIGSVAVLTQGVTGKDFGYVSGGTCAMGTMYAANATCTVEYSFTPTRPGQRPGSIVLESNASPATPMGMVLLAATGTGPLVTFPGSTAVSALANSASVPSGMAVDSAGDVLVVDNYTGSVYEVEAGTGGNAPGAVSSSSTVVMVASGITDPSGIAVDSAGDVFVTEYIGNGAIYKIEAGTGGNAPGVISPTSTMVTVGGGFNFPGGVAVDASGNVFVADTYNNAIKEIEAGTGGNAPGVVSSSSTVVTLAGSYTYPGSVAVDAAGNVFATGNDVQEIEAGTGGNSPGVVSSSSTVTTVLAAGVGFSGLGLLSVDAAGNLFVGTETGIYEVEAGTGGNPVGVVSSSSTVVPVGSGLSRFGGLAIDGLGNLFVNGQNRSRVVEKIALATPPALSFASTAVGTPSSDSPKAVAVQNAGNAPLSFSSIALGSNASFTLDSTTSCSISTPLGESGLCSVAVDFAPVATGLQSSTLMLTDNSLNNNASSQVVGLSGTGEPPTVTGISPTSGTVAGGTTVTITGTNLSGATVVNFGANAATVLSNTATQIVATSPAVATTGVVDVTVTTAGGTDTISAADQFTYTATAPGAPTGVTATAGNASATMSFMAPSSNGGAAITGYTVTSSPGGITASGTSSPITVTGLSNGVAYTFTVTATNAVGTSVASGPSNSVTPEAGAGAYVWLVYADGTSAKVTEGGSTAVASSGTAGAASTAGGAAVDGAGSVWTVSSANNVLQYSPKTGTGGGSCTGGGLSSPSGVIIDGAGNVWVANAGNSTVSEFTHGCAAVSPGAGYSTVATYNSATATAPSGIAIDGAGSVWTSDHATGTVTRIVGAAAPTVTSTAAAETAGTLGQEP